MFGKKSCNIKSTESYFRLLIATFILFYAFISSAYILLLISFALYYTGFKRFCPIYYLFKFNKKYNLKNYYLSLLPKHRTSPVFIFNEKSEIIFSNDSAEVELKNVISLQNLNVTNYIDIINSNSNQIIMYDCNNKNYQIELIGISSEKVILAYFTDVTELIELNKEIENTQSEVIYAMGEIGETRSKETGSHVKRVALYSKELALLCGLSKKDANILQMASPMHDIGKVGIADSILNAPRRLTEEEFTIMKTHAELGYKMLEKSNKPILQAAAIVAHEHHEKWDGSGYPNAKSGEDIHIYGRITAIADVFDALGSARVYKKAWELEDILDFFKNESAKHFDPKLMELFLNNLDIFLKIRNRVKD